MAKNTLVVLYCLMLHLMFLWCLVCYNCHISLLGVKLRKCVNFRNEILYLVCLNVLKCLKLNTFCKKKLL